MRIGIGIGMNSAGRGWSPAQIPNGVAGWDFSALALAADAEIASVSPIIGATSLVQATSANRPIFKPTGINGNPAAFFATDDFMTADAVAAQFSGQDTPSTSFGVLQMSDLGANQVASGFAANATLPFFTQRKANTNVGQVQRQGDGDGAGLTAPGAASFALTPIAFVRVFTGTKVTVYTGIAQTALPDDVAMDSGACTFTQFTIGCLRRNTNAQFMTGYWGALILATGAADVTARSRFFQWARSRFGTA